MAESQRKKLSEDSKIWLVLLGIIVLFTIVVMFARQINLSRQNSQSQVPVVARYTNYAYGVNLRYPPEWRPVGGGAYDRYEGESGFFSVGAGGVGNITMDQVIRNEVDNPKQPYGTEPYTQTLVVDGERAKLIMPSPDQSADMHGQAVLIVEYPEPKIIGTQTYNFLVFWADRANIQDITSSITFVR